MPGTSAKPRTTQRGTVTARPSLSRISGVFQTSPGLLRRRLVGPWGEGLAQYLTLRIGELERGRTAYRSLLRTLNSLPPEELVVPPGPKARLYRLARTIAECEEPSAKPIALPWRKVDGARGAAIERLRGELARDEAELLELAHARELVLDEIACVLERPTDEVELALDGAHARARRILGEHAPDPSEPTATIYVEAFALDQSPLPDAADALIEEEDAELEPGTIIGGRYKLVERVGVGAFGDVYRADDTEVPGHRVALKLLRQPSLSETARQSALRELRLNAAVFHPSLVQFKDHGWWEQRLWFVMPWYAGETLEKRMRRAPLTRKEAREIFEPLARALAALHETGIRHQDIKPDNVLLTQLPGAGLLPVLIDLGVAADEQEGLLGGTPLYFAPEVAARFAGGEEEDFEIGPAADVFALALALRNALEPDTEEDVPAGAIRAFILRRSEGAPAFPSARSLRFLAPTFARWLSKRPADRPSAEQFAEELAILTAPEERRARNLRIARWLVPLLMLLGAAFATSVYFLNERAVVRQKEAESARSEAASARADLLVLDARRRALEEGRAELQGRVAQGALSRRELEQELRTSEAQVRILRNELANTIESRTAMRDELAVVRRTLREREEAIAALTSERSDLRAELAELESAIEAARADGRRRDQELAELRGRVRELGNDINAERTARRAAEDRAVEMSAQLADAIRAQRAAEEALERARTPQPSPEPAPTDVPAP